MVNYFSVPEFDDPEIQRKANILVATQHASAVMILLIVLFSMLLTPDRLEVILQGLVGVGAMFGSFVLLKKGKLNLSAWIIVILGWLILTIDLALISGIRGVNVLGQVLIVIFAGLAINGKAGLVVTLISILTNFGIYQAEVSGLLVDPNPLPTSFIRWLIQAIYVSLAAIYIWRADSTITKAIRESQSTANRFRTLFSHTNDGVVVFNPDWTVAMANRQLTRLLGYQDGELSANTFILEKAVQDSQEVVRFQERVLEEKDIPKFEQLLVRKDGSEIPVEISVTSVLNHIGDLRQVQCVIRDITDQKAYEKHLRYMAQHDPLTDLPNRNYFDEKFQSVPEDVIDRQTQVAVMFIDLDNFKSVNDSFGHSVGDQVLIDIGRRIKNTIRESDTVARIGGDEFLIILENVPDRLAVSKIAKKLVDQVSQPFQIDGHDIRISASIGIQLTERDKLNEIDLLETPDAVMYQVKAAGKNAYKFFDPDR